MYDYETDDTRSLEWYRNEYRRLGLYIFETFEEYMQDKEEEER